MKIEINVDAEISDTQIKVSCSRLTPEIEKLLAMLRILDRKLTAAKDGEIYLLDVGEIIFLEAVDRKTFVYTKEEIYESDFKLYELEQQLADLAAREQELTDTAVAYSNAIQQADAAISAAEADLAANEEALAETQRQYEQAQEEWRQWTAANNVDFEYNQGGFAWPIPGYTNLSSDFGVGRWIYGKWDVHRGMDVPAPAGTPIYAAADGVVSTNNHWTYGISVKISHGSGLATIYGHMSARAVNDGDYVTQGQLIGYVGSTGNSTGNHLHFETTLNGAAVSSRPYLGPPWG